MARAFISYKHNIEPDERLAGYLARYLSEQGHEVFIDTRIRIGAEWPAVIESEIRQADALILLLSAASSSSEMVIEEVKIARKVRSENNRPAILPIRLAFTGDLPYDMGAWLDRIQYALWERDGDEAAIGQKLDEALRQGTPLPGLPAAANPSPAGLAADGNLLTPGQATTNPLPAFDPRWLDELDDSGGVVKLDSPFYVERCDPQVKARLAHDGITVKVKGYRQMGKTSLMARLYQHARQAHVPVVFLDFQTLDQEEFASLDMLLRALANRLARRLHTNRPPEHYWNGALGPKDKLTDFVTGEILEHAEPRLLLLFDEVDRVFGFPAFRDDFFSLIRAWHDSRAFDPLWEKFNLVMAYSSEARFFITNLNQSPFNVGENFELSDFDAHQVAYLNARHGSPIRSASELEACMELLHGHPFLVRKAFYELTARGLSVPQLLTSAGNDDGLFSDHLHHYLIQFDAQPMLREGMRSAIRDGVCPTDLVFHRLRAGGLVLGHDRTQVVPRCGLYARYFGAHL